MKTKYKTIEVDKEWIENNVSLIDWQRKIYPARVNTFVNYIRNGTFRNNTLLTFWKKEGQDKFFILDGQHKLEAIKKTGEKRVFDLRIIESSGKEEITEEDMMEEYETLADVKHHRTIDIIKMYLYGHKQEWVIAFLDEKYFPINVTENGGVNSLGIDNLITILYNGLKKTIVRTSLSKKKLKPFLESIDSEKYSLMKGFCQVYKNAFGEPSSDNWMYKTIVMFTLMRVWIANKEFFNEEEFVVAFKRVEQNASIRQDSHVANKEILESMTRKIYRVLNYKRSANRFVQFWDEEILIPKQ